MNPKTQKKKKTETKKKFRPPVVTVMGHVDHGKTTLLDTIRKTSVQQKEAGGITQSIGAYQVDVDTKEGKKSITFIDTPGHEAFTAMRARGAQVTDIVVLVVAANDGVKPQTIEAINHAKKAQVPIIVAINKIDLSSASPDKVKEQLAKHELLAEDWGGQTIFVNISAKKNQNIKELLEIITLVAEMEELVENPKDPFLATVIESHLNPQKGPVCSILVRSGSLKIGDKIYHGSLEAKIKGMVNDKGETIQEASISTPAEILGLKEVIPVGATITKKKKERENLKKSQEKEELDSPKTDIDDFFKDGEKENQSLKILLKADNEGCLEAISESLASMQDDDHKIEIIHQASGPVNESDVLLSKVSEAFILNFNLKTNPKILNFAQNENVPLYSFDIIYKLLEKVQEIIQGQQEEKNKKISGQAKVLAVFKSSKDTQIAGIKVIEGLIRKNKKVEVFRKDEKVYEGEIETMKHLKEEVKELKKNMEGGITIEPDFDFEKDDIIQYSK